MSNASGGISGDLAERRSRWGNLVTALEDDWEDDGSSVAPGRPAARVSTFGGDDAGTAYNHYNQWSTSSVGGGHAGSQPNHLAKRGAVALSDWIASSRAREDGADCSSSSRRKHLEDVVRILHSLARKIAGDAHAMNFDGHEGIAVHRNFIKITNIVVTESTEWVGVRGDSELSADFVECGDSIFHTDGGEDEAKKMYGAMDALGRVAYEMCMRGDGPSVDKFFAPEETGASMSNAIDIKGSGGGDAGDEMEDEIIDMLRKTSRTITSEENGSGLVSVMLGAGIPFPLCRFVSDLFVDRDGSLFRSERSFTSYRDVIMDLKQMMDSPDGCLHASSPDRWKLTFGDKLYGRSSNLEAFMDAANRVSSLRRDPIFDMLAGLKGKRREVVMVSGHSGAGKSRLVRVGSARLEEKGWRFLRCKFDRVVHPEPLSILASAFDKFFGAFASCPRHRGSNGNNQVSDLECSCPEGSQELRQRLTKTISPDGLGVLAKHVPSLRLMLDITLPSSHIQLNETMMASLFIKLLRVLSSRSTPIIFFMDDLQWADPLSLKLLPLLVNANDLQLSPASSCGEPSHGFDGAHYDEICIMFVGSYRDNEVGGGHSLTKVLHKFEEDKSISLTSICLSRFNLDTLNLMLSESLCVPVRRVRPLSELVIQKTDGQPLHVIEFIQALAADSLLTHSFERGWEWDADSIDICSISDSVAELYAFKLHRLSKDALRGLQILSCFGSQIDNHMLGFVAGYDGDRSVDIDAAIRVGLNEGLLELAAHLISFSHDLIQKATLDSIGEIDLPPLLCKLASALTKNASAAGKLDVVLFVVVDLVNRVGTDGAPCPEDRTRFAELNLLAGSEAMAVPDFAGAAKYAEHGIAFLRDDCWETQYDLSIRLYETAVLSHFSSLEGERDKLTSRIESVFERAREFDDKFKTYCIWINELALKDLAKAIEESLNVLELLGEPLSVADVDHKRVREELVKYESRAGRDRKKDLLSAKRMTDCNKMKAMKVMASLLYYYYQTQSMLALFVACQMMELSMKHGHCEHSVFAAASVASSFVNVSGDIDESNAWGRTTLSLMDVYNNDDLIPPVYSALYGIVFVVKEPIQSTLEPLAKAIRVSFARGIVEFGINSTIFYVYRSFISGKGCRVLIGEVAALARQHGNNSFGDESTKPASILNFYLTPLYSLLCDLEGQPEKDMAEPQSQMSMLEHLGERPAFPLDEAKFVDADELIDAALGGIGTKQLAGVIGLLAYQTARALLFRDMNNALRYTDLYFEHFVEKHKTTEMSMKYNAFYNVFMEALIMFYFKRQTGEERYLARGEDALAKMKEWAIHSDWNWKNKLLLMEAECSFARQRFDQAATCYESSVKAARAHRFIHEEALGSELAAIFFLERGLREKARSYFEHSVRCYEKWGAYFVANRVADVMKNEFGSDSAQAGSDDGIEAILDASTKTSLNKRPIARLD